MKKKKAPNIFKNYKVICFSLIVICILFLSIGFSAFQNNLYIDDLNAIVRIDKDIRISGVEIDSVNNAVSSYENFNVSNITSKVSLPNEDSYIIYNISIYNLGNVPMGIKSISINNDNLKAEFIDYNLKDKICENDKCTLGIKKTIKLKVSYKDNKYDSNNTSQSFLVDFDFGTIFNVTYNNIDNISQLPTNIIEGDTYQATIDSGNANLVVKMNDKVLTINTDYTYSNNVLNIPNVSGALTISLNDRTIMEDKIISQYISSNDESDISVIDLDTMTSDEKANNFSNISTNSGIYETKGISGKDVIVFRGNITNNYVRINGILWRILQIDEDGNLKLIMDSTISSTSKYNSSSSVTSLSNAQTVLGFSNSTAKTALETWYANNLKDFENLIKDSKFCNNFTYKSIVSSGSNKSVNYFQSYLNVGADASNYTPSLTCPETSIITNKIGLISAEEVVLAGGAFRKDNTSYFLYNSDITTSWWSLSPAYYDSNQKNGMVFFIEKTGKLNDYVRDLTTSSYGLRPVITIDGNVSMQGDGTKSNPYMFSEDNSYDGYKENVTDLSELNNGKYYIAHTGGVYSVDGLLTSTTSGIGLLGTNSATFTTDKLSIKNISGEEFSFINGQKTNDGYLYQIVSEGGKYLTIGTDKTVSLSETPTNLKVKLCDNTSYTGRIIISNEDETMYLNFYGAENTSDNKFAGWNKLDLNGYMVLYKAK